MTTLKPIPIENILLSPLRPPGSIPNPSAVDINNARLYGIEILPTIKTRQIGNGFYELIQGLLAWRAAQFLQVEFIEIQVLNIDDTLAREMIFADFKSHMIRQNPITEAKCIKEMATAQSTTPSAIGKLLHMDRFQVSTLLRLLQLSKDVQNLIQEGKLPVGKAKMLITLSKDQQTALAQQIIQENWSTRKVEERLRLIKKGTPKATGTDDYQKKDTEILNEEQRLTDIIGSPVQIDHDTQKGSGTITITYSNLDVYTGIAKRLEQSPTDTTDDFYV